MFEQLHVFFSQISLFNSFFLNVLRAQCLYCTEPRACGSKLLISGELACCSSQMPLMGCILGAPGLHSAPHPFISQFVEISRCTKACKFKICFEENGVAFFFFFALKWAVSLSIAASSLAREDICRNGMQKWYKCSQIEYIYRCKRLRLLQACKSLWGEDCKSVWIYGVLCHRSLNTSALRWVCDNAAPTQLRHLQGSPQHRYPPSSLDPSQSCLITVWKLDLSSSNPSVIDN